MTDNLHHPALETFRRAWLGGRGLPLTIKPGWCISSLAIGGAPNSIELVITGGRGDTVRVSVSPTRPSAPRYGKTRLLDLVYIPAHVKRSPDEIAGLLESVKRLLENAEGRLGNGDVVAAFKGKGGLVEASGTRHETGFADVVGYFHVDYRYGRSAKSTTSRIGILYRCNQACSFCSLARMNIEVPPRHVRRAMRESLARGSRKLVITGGEPTLSHHLMDYIEYAQKLGFEDINVQTNAVLLDNPVFTAALRSAGLTSAQVSLHGMDEAISDSLTGAPGTHARTLRGVDNLLDSRVFVYLNHLIFKDNCRRLVGFVNDVGRRWGDSLDIVRIQFHAPKVEYSTREMALLHIARYSSYAGNLRRAIGRARELGISIRDMQDPTGIPSLCVFGADERVTGPIQDQSNKPRFHAAESGWLTRVEACSDCKLFNSCMGIPRDYLDLYGDAEFRPIRR